MTSSEKIQILQDELIETIETKKPELARRFVIHLTESQDRDRKDILHSIELLAQQMSSMQNQMNTRFEAVDKRFEDTNKRFTQLTWFIGVIFIAISSMMTIFKFLK